MEVEPALVALFGSETRLRLLAVLANAQHPMSAYRVAKVGEVRPPKAYPQLDRLRAAGLVAGTPSGWIITDNDVAALLRKRVRIAWEGDWFRDKPKRDREDRRRYRELRRGPSPVWDGIGPLRHGVARRRAKDELLVRHGLRPSVPHGP